MKLTNKTSLKVYRVVIHIDMTLMEFALRNKNCILTQHSAWRLTYHTKEFSMNLFVATKLRVPGLVAIVFSQSKKIEEIIDIFRNSLFAASTFISSPKSLNWVEKFYTGINDIDLEQIYDDIVDLENVYVDRKVTKTVPKISSYVEDDKKIKIDAPADQQPELNINMQIFSALIMKPFPEESNMTVQIYPTGKINVTGIPSDHYLDKVTNYITDTLVPLMQKHSFIDETHSDF